MEGALDCQLAMVSGESQAGSTVEASRKVHKRLQEKFVGVVLSVYKKQCVGSGVESPAKSLSIRGRSVV